MIVTDPAFYAAAVPAVLLMGLAKSGFLAGFGALAVPLMALAVPVPQAAAIMLPLLAVMDLTGLQQLWRERDAALLRLLLPPGLAGIVVGALLFGSLSSRAVAGVLGVLTLAFVAQRVLAPPRADRPPPARAVGAGLALLSGFTSFVAHAGGPPISAYVLPLGMAPLRLTATMAVFFAALNTSKWIPYAWLGLIDGRNLATSLVLMPLAPLGVRLGIAATRRIEARRFYRIAYLGMALTGAKLLADAFA